jgi:hypothetical protein
MTRPLAAAASPITVQHHDLWSNNFPSDQIEEGCGVRCDRISLWTLTTRQSRRTENRLLDNPFSATREPCLGVKENVVALP